MRRVLRRHGFTNVLCDCFASDTTIIDPHFIAETLLSQVDMSGGGGSIFVMPGRPACPDSDACGHPAVSAMRSVRTRKTWHPGVTPPKRGRAAVFDGLPPTSIFDAYGPDRDQ